MPELPKEVAERLEIVLDIMRTIFHVGFLPLMLYLGWRHGPEKGAQPFTLTNFLWYY